MESNTGSNGRPSLGFRVVREYLGNRDREMAGLRFVLTGELRLEGSDEEGTGNETLEGGDLRPSER